MSQGFTLIELLVVVLIIGILSAVALPQYQAAVERSRAAEALTQMAAVADSIERYHAQHDAWPTRFTQLDVDIPKTGTNEYGGKYFTLGFGNDGEASVFNVAATRRGNTYPYVLTTVITEEDGAYARTRKCGPAGATSATDETVVSTCNAISGGHPDNF